MFCCFVVDVVLMFDFDVDVCVDDVMCGTLISVIA